MRKILLILINLLCIAIGYTQRSDEFRTFFYANLFPSAHGNPGKTSQVKIDWYCSTNDKNREQNHSNKVKELPVRIGNEVVRIKGIVIRKLNSEEVEFKSCLSKVYWDYPFDSLEMQLERDTVGRIEEMIGIYTDSMIYEQLSDSASFIKVYSSKTNRKKIYFKTDHSIILVKIFLRKSCKGRFEDNLSELMDYLSYSVEEKDARYRYELYKIENKPTQIPTKEK